MTLAQTLFSVIIPTCGRSQELKRCLHALMPLEQTFDSKNFEILVSDDKYSEELKNDLVVHYPTVKYAIGPAKGPASNRNNAAHMAVGKFLIFLDDDCIPDKTLLIAYAEAIEQNPNTKVFEGRIYADRPQASFAETSPINEKGGHLWSCNFAINREYFLALRGFDERFPFAAMEDVELQRRILDSGESIHFTEKAAACHPWRKKNIADFQKHQASTLLYLSIHPSERKRINTIYYLYLVAYGLLRFVLPKTIKGKTKGLTIQIVEYLYYLKMAAILAVK